MRRRVRFGRESASSAWVPAFAGMTAQMWVIRAGAAARELPGYFSQPRLRKYQNGAIALAIISAHAHG